MAWRCGTSEAMRPVSKPWAVRKLWETAVPVAQANRRRASQSLDDVPHRPRLSCYPPVGPTHRLRDLYGSLSALLGITCPWVRTALSPGRSRTPKQARSSPFHRLADSIIVTSDWLPERRPAHHRGQQPDCSAGAFRPCGWQAQVRRFDCCMAASQRRIPLSCHRICSPPPTRGHKIREISAQIEFLGGTGGGFRSLPSRILFLSDKDKNFPLKHRGHLSWVES